MKFGTTLRKAIYRPWKEQYVDYDKLKKLLKEDDASSSFDEQDDKWTDEDESAFVDELMNTQLEKVHSFQTETTQKLRDRLTACEQKLGPLTNGPKLEKGDEEGATTSTDDSQQKADLKPEEREKLLKEVLAELDEITKEVNELEKFGRINYVALYKITKKHDRKRGNYKLRPFLETRLTKHPINKEDYSPLLYRSSMMYSFVRQSLDGKSQEAMSFSESQTGGESFTSHKFWVHPQNILEIKTIILRRLPVLVYNPQTSKVAEGSQRDPTLTSIYFDNPNFTLYNDKVENKPDASSLRLRWYGPLDEKPEILLEKKTIKDGDASEEQRFPIKEKYIQPFIEGQYKMEKSIRKLQDRSGDHSDKVDELQESVENIQSFIKDNELQPVLRANYTRTAFQIPGDDNVRVSLDTNLALIREDSIDTERPIRDPEDWHRKDIDDAHMEWPFDRIRKGEIKKLPFAVLEIKTKGRKKYEWVDDLMDSHLVKSAPRFSKFVHGVASLFEDHVNMLPSWFTDAAVDIRREPQEAFEEEQKRKARAADDEFAVGSLFGTTHASPSFKPSITSPVGSPAGDKSIKDRTPAKSSLSLARSVNGNGKETVNEEEDSDEDGADITTYDDAAFDKSSGLGSLFPSFSSSKYARAHQQRKVNLPPGVKDPGVWIKDQGPNKVEAKVWLANQRTFVKWMHVGVTLYILSLGLYNAAGSDNWIAQYLGIVYFAIAIFILFWGYTMYLYRNKLIRERSPKDFDAPLGPIVVCIALIIALCLNFGFKYNAIVNNKNSSGNNPANSTVVERIELM